MSAYDYGCKGFTVYRDGCRTGVLVSADTKDTKKETVDPFDAAPKRPKRLPCDIHQATIRGEKWTIFVGMHEDKPYEIFGGLSKYIEIPKKYKQGILEKDGKKPNGSSMYDLLYGEGEDETKLHDIINIFENITEASHTRSISLSLRHGVPIQYVVEQLSKDDKQSDMYSFSKVIARVLKHYIKEGVKASDKNCESCEAKGTIIYKEGCKICVNCGSSRCG
jgi:ribonucleoside-diphosphate reductase alpha chain